MGIYRATKEEANATKLQRELLHATVRTKKDLYHHLKLICNKDKSTEKDFKELAIARLEWHDAGLQYENYLSNLYKQNN